MPKISGPFHSLFYPDYNGDRVYSDEDFGLPFRLDHSNGVYLNQSAQALQITAAGDMNLTIRAGYCFIEGHFGGTPMDGSMTLDNADGIYPRIDRIVMRHYGAGGELDERKLAPLVLTGTPAQNPKAPDIVRNGAYYDLSLATVLVPAGAIEITAANITDTRFDTSVCGAVTGNNENPLDTTELFAQFTALFNQMTDSQKAEFAELVKSWTDQTAANQAEFDAFMGQLHDVMGENVATNLLNLVNALRTDVDRHTGELSQHGESLNQHNTRISTLESEFPTVSKTGAIQWFAGNPPSGWILCDGRAFYPSSFSKLYNAIGKKFTGSPYTNSTFCIPDFSKEFGTASIWGLKPLSYRPSMVAQDYSSVTLYSNYDYCAGDAFFTGFSPAHVEAGNLTYDGVHFIKKGVFYWDGSLKLASSFDARCRNLIYSKKINLTLLWPDFNNTKYYIASTPEEVMINPSERDWFTVTPSFPVPSGVSGYTYLCFYLGPQSGDIYVLCQTTTTAGKTAYFVNYTSNGFSWTTLGRGYCESAYAPLLSSPSSFLVSEYINGGTASSRVAFILLNHWIKADGSTQVMVMNAGGGSSVHTVPLGGAAGRVLNSDGSIGLAAFANSSYVGVWAGHNDNVSPRYYTCSITRMDASGSSSVIYENTMRDDAKRVAEENIVETVPYSIDGRLWFRASRKQLGSVSTTGSCVWCKLDDQSYMQSVYKSHAFEKQPRCIFQLEGRIMASAIDYRGSSGIWGTQSKLLPYINTN